MDEELKSYVDMIFKNLDADFYKDSIEKLIIRCDNCLNLRGNYFLKKTWDFRE